MKETDIEKVYRIAKELGIGIEEAAITCDGFELAFSDDRMRRAIFEMIDQLDVSGAKKGEPFGLIINYTVELGMDGIRVGRYSDEIPEGQVVELTPSHRAKIYLKINDNFPTQEFLGPLIVNRPEPLAKEECLAKGDGLNDNDIDRLASLAKHGVVCSDEAGSSVETHPGRGGLTYTDTTQPEIPTELPSHWRNQAICLGPIRFTFNERFPCVSGTKSSQPTALPARMPAFRSKAHNPSSWAILPAGMPAFQLMSGLSPPSSIGESGHS